VKDSAFLLSLLGHSLVHKGWMKTNVYSLTDKIQKEEQRRKEHYLSSMQVPKDLFSFVDDWDLLFAKERFEFKRTQDIATPNDIDRR